MAVDPGEAAPMVVGLDQLLDAKLSIPQPRPGSVSRAKLNSGQLQANDDGSYDLCFGPTAPDGKESNWVEIIPGRSWFQFFRLYGTLRPWFDQTWRLHECEPIN
jgi:hypothetical protein